LSFDMGLESVVANIVPAGPAAGKVEGVFRNAFQKGWLDCGCRRRGNAYRAAILLLHATFVALCNARNDSGQSLRRNVGIIEI
ncbi:MAG: hypothetical protein ABIJ56_17705, partial [Pseudomonadota bacterium]